MEWNTLKRHVVSLPSSRTMKPTRKSGFSLTELTIVLTILALLLVFALPISSTLLENEKRSVTVKKMDNIQAALVNFVMTNRRLPCPSDGTLQPADSKYGLEDRDINNGVCVNFQASGVVPWKSIGLSEADASDAWYNKITYRSAYSLTLDAALDMSNCDSAGTATAVPVPPTPPNVSLGVCALTCTGLFNSSSCTSVLNFLVQKGLNVSDGTHALMSYVANTGAAFVLISHGQNGYGALSASGVYQASAAKGVVGALEQANVNSDGHNMVKNTAPPTLNDAPFSDAPDGTVYFDDIVVRPSILTLINKAQLGPRSH